MKWWISICVVFYLWSCNDKPLPVITGFEGKEMPKFSLLLNDSTIISSEELLKKGTPIGLLIFSPYCPYCQAEIKDLIKNRKNLGVKKLFLVTWLPFQDVKGFYRAFKLNMYPEVTFGKDLNDSLKLYFKPKAVPYLALYNSKHQLSKVYVGYIDAKVAEDIIK